MTLNIKSFFIIVILLVAGYQGYQRWTQRPIAMPAGVVAPNEPVQQAINHPESFIFKGFQLSSVAYFDIQAKLISKKDYNSDKEAELSPIDLGVGWGRLSDIAVLKQFDFSQSGRFLFYRYDSTPSVPIDEVNRSITNIHIIPATETIEKKIDKLRVGSVIHLEGRLVNISKSNAGTTFTWNTSTTRTDTGKGACEVLFVDNVE